MTNPISVGNRLSLQLHISSDCEQGKNHHNISYVVAQSNVQLPLDRFQIVHTTTGRVRIRARESSFYSQLESISQQLRQQEGIKEVTNNQQTGSLVINFDEHQVSLPQILAILQKLGVAESHSHQQADVFAELKSTGYWQEKSIALIPLLTGLTVTGGLGISGWAAIPVYMITADATRWIIDYLQVPVLASSKMGLSDEPPSNPKEEAASPGGELKNVQSPKVTYDVVHAIPGRIRLHVPQLAQDQAYAQRLTRLLKADDAVISVRMNCDAASVAIAYRDQQRNISHWVKLLELALHTPPIINSVAEVKMVSGIWADMKFVSLSYCLNCLANLAVA